MYRAPTVKKAFQILKLIAKHDKPMTISELSAELGINKSTAHGIAGALEEIGAVVRDKKTKRYTLGMTLFELARSSYARIDLKDIAHPHMEDLMEATQQSVFLGTRSNNHVTIIDTVGSDQTLKITSPIGTRVPLLAGAIGKAFLASIEESRAVSMIRTMGLRKFTENSITDIERYMLEVGKARASGYGMDDEEYMQGVRAVAAVIPGSRQQMSAVWVVGFTPSMSAEKIPAIAMETKRAAEKISRRIDLRPLEG
ncbi:IclR family transcriptional regulator [Thermodesulfobacteriota bacterium]